MEIIYLLIPLSLVLVGLALWGFFWAVRSGQFDDMDSPALSILEEPIIDEPVIEVASEIESEGNADNATPDKQT